MTEGVKEYFSFVEVSRMFGVAKKTVRKWYALGYLRAVKLGRQYYVHRDVLEALKQRAKGEEEKT